MTDHPHQAGSPDDLNRDAEFAQRTPDAARVDADPDPTETVVDSYADTINESGDWLESQTDPTGGVDAAGRAG
ncbi:hypothetical protein [Propioniciclava soli]|uniref:Uncharacterized protein n=1 Tax=Propioniciclava soli TaxID=2775081 RepID=A0ABZ3C4Y3_9ACTN|nr:hypothetical protein [Propioniciclava soli]